MIHPDHSNARISNYVKIIDKQHIGFDPPRGLKKVLNIWKIDSDWKGDIHQKKLLEDKIIEEKIEQEQLVNGSI